jgi:hypothetical protein
MLQRPRCGIIATGGNAASLAAMETRAVDATSLGVPTVFEARKLGYRAFLNLSDLAIPFLQGGIGATKQVLAERLPKGP